MALGPVTLSTETVEAIAARVVELLRREAAMHRQAATPPKLTAAELATRLGVERAWIYQHAAQLGAIRLGAGPRARLRFDAELVAERLSARDTWPQMAPGRPSLATRRPRRIGSSSPELLPIKGDVELSSTTATEGRPGGAQTPPAAAPKGRPAAR
jgi:hypothetical protein